VPLVTPLRVFDGGQLDVQFRGCLDRYVRQSVRIKPVAPCRRSAAAALYAADFGGESGVLESCSRGSRTTAAST